MFLRKQDKTAVWCGDRYFIWTKYPGVLLRPQLLLGVSRSLFLQCRSMCIHMGGKIKKKPAKWNRWQIQLFYSPLNIYSVKRPRATSKIQKNKTKQQDTHTKKKPSKRVYCLSASHVKATASIIWRWKDSLIFWAWVVRGKGEGRHYYSLYTIAGFCSAEFNYLCNHHMHYISKNTCLCGKMYQLWFFNNGICAEF